MFKTLAELDFPVLKREAVDHLDVAFALLAEVVQWLVFADFAQDLLLLEFAVLYACTGRALLRTLQCALDFLLVVRLLVSHEQVFVVFVFVFQFLLAVSALLIALGPLLLLLHHGFTFLLLFAEWVNFGCGHRLEVFLQGRPLALEDVGRGVVVLDEWRVKFISFPFGLGPPLGHPSILGVVLDHLAFVLLLDALGKCKLLPLSQRLDLRDRLHARKHGLLAHVVFLDGEVYEAPEGVQLVVLNLLEARVHDVLVEVEHYLAVLARQVCVGLQVERLLGRHHVGRSQVAEVLGERGQGLRLLKLHLVQRLRGMVGRGFEGVVVVQVDFYRILVRD
mmetsp:Transcript_78648/g.169977  ORF Transcript_78648/g.169977 Transcript_78648/m.169977 type:complete len:335 (-) Transcript_78648:168-1172(-)